MPLTTSSSRLLVLSPSTESTVYGLFALAMGLTLVGVYVGTQFYLQLLTSGMGIVFIIIELALIMTSRLWMDKSPLNVILFALFPLISGITITPYILYVLLQYANGSAILINAFAATACMALAAAVFARTTSWNLSGMARGLFLALLGLIALGLLQVFIPSMRGGSTELLISGGGVIVFALFTAYDIQRVQTLARAGQNPFLLALSLYLDLFNLFLYVLRFMTALSGERRRSW
jgi:FtsH-binding integral membrane protein